MFPGWRSAYYVGAVERILVSSCLLGLPVRYDGRAKANGSALLARWRAEGRLVSFCPELAGGLGVPRPAAERVHDRVLTRDGTDVTDSFRRGAELALHAAVAAGAAYALLKEGSPSCGTHRIADGTFTRTQIPGTGLTTELIRAHGIRVFNEDEIHDLDALLRKADA